MSTTPLLAIGAVSAATGIPVSTLRTWERRYGWPAPVRTSGGQRLYAHGDIDRLRRIARAMERGHRAAQIMRMDDASLTALTGEGPPTLEAWMEAVRAMDGDAFQRMLRRDAAGIGIVEFLEHHAAPFMVRLGEAWADGTILPLHEHFASEQLRDFLVGIWRPMAEAGTGPIALCATLPGEQHALGLQMAATVLALRGWRVVMIGADTPVDDLREGTLQSGAQGLFLSLSPCLSRSQTRAALNALRRGLPDDVRLVAGGSGAPVGLRGVDVITRLDAVPRPPS